MENILYWKSNANWGYDASFGTSFVLDHTDADIIIHLIDGFGKFFCLSAKDFGISHMCLGTEDFDEAVKMAKIIIQKKLNYLEENANILFSGTSNEQIKKPIEY